MRARNKEASKGDLGNIDPKLFTFPLSTHPNAHPLWVSMAYKLYILLSAHSCGDAHEKESHMIFSYPSPLPNFL